MGKVIHEERQLSFFEKYLTVWVFLCIGLGILLGKLFPQAAITLDSIAVFFQRRIDHYPTLKVAAD